MIHPKAQVDADVHLGERTRVWQFASVIRGAHLGKDCSVASCAIVDGAMLGDRVLIGHGASVHPGIKVGSDVFIGPGAVLANDRWPSVSKDGFSAFALLFDDRFVVIVEDGASVCSNAVVLPGVRIGAGSLVAAHATVTRDVPAGCLWTRDGETLPKPVDWRERRMRWAS